MSKKYFIKINNEWLINANENNIFTRIGTEGFAIYCVLLQIKNNNDKFLVNIFVGLEDNSSNNPAFVSGNIINKDVKNKDVKNIIFFIYFLLFCL